MDVVNEYEHENENENLSGYRHVHENEILVNQLKSLTTH